MAGGMSELARRIFYIQEERKALYGDLKRAQEDYVKSKSSFELFQQSVAAATSSFTSLSQEMMKIEKIFTENDKNNVSELIKGIQEQEKEKLELSVQYQVSIIRGEQDQKDNHHHHDNEDDDDDNELATVQLRRQLSVCEAAIASLLEDLRYECEELLLTKHVD
ncbi:PREDICTED: uncharacterized protein LOC109584700 [Amphimedon queenslandica]|uniref:Uncharacterized protein n=1 Tax=Amphimedon queenslandica TaxID=400682 RepID=A0A1X7U4G0_AMPQE|nr:PREDICTED: uncharacterized protein LOC109584700 [Amphimedon queenslandica]|eukprot:XP_019856090.1 PREDICTED: uncharacterized protein LOC109584700 [Amphimedon queenslandica]